MSTLNFTRVADTLNLTTEKMIADKDYAYTAGYLQSLLIETIEKYVKTDADLTAIQARLLAAIGIDVSNPKI